MGKLVNTFKTNKIAFFLLLCLFVNSYFEYFFRGNLPVWIVLFVFAVISLSKYSNDLLSRYRNYTIIYIVANTLVCFLQVFKSPSVSIIYGIGQATILFSYLLVGTATKETLFEKFVFLMTIIATYSVIIYGLCVLFPPIKEYLVTVVCPNYPSMGAEKAIQEGGGINFIIYNFQQASEYAMLNRNCGPFWEPGMFAVFLDLALFVNLYLIRGKKIASIILAIALLTTMSTGGYVGGLFIVSSFFVLERKHVVLSFFSVIIFVVLSYLFFTYDFLGDKLIQQMTVFQLGNDESRFGALLTHWKIFTDNPLCGYYGIEGYTVDGRMALASGLLIPLSSRGLFVGALYYIMLYKASINYSLYYTHKKQVGVFLFLLILLLSMSQTILLTSCILVFIFAGLTLKMNNNRSNQLDYAAV